jgi:hypothetical protein
VAFVASTMAVTAMANKTNNDLADSLKQTVKQQQ